MGVAEGGSCYLSKLASCRDYLEPAVLACTPVDTMLTNNTMPYPYAVCNGFVHYVHYSLSKVNLWVGMVGLYPNRDYTMASNPNPLS